MKGSIKTHLSLELWRMIMKRRGRGESRELLVIELIGADLIEIYHDKYWANATHLNV